MSTHKQRWKGPSLAEVGLPTCYNSLVGVGTFDGEAEWVREHEESYIWSNLRLFVVFLSYLEMCLEKRSAEQASIIFL